MKNGENLNIERIFADKFHLERSVYRKKISAKKRFNFRLDYKYTDLFITSDRDIGKELEELVPGFYKDIEMVLSRDPVFEKSLAPVGIKDYYPPIIRKMCQAGELFNVGPMASVAGAVCDYLAEYIEGRCGFLMIENGGDVYIKSSSQLEVGIFTRNKYFKDKLNLKIEACQTPCGICSSSGSFGHSLSLGKSDLVTILSRSTVLADAAATAVANSIESSGDIDKAIGHYRDYREVEGMIIIKDNKIGLWGELQLSSPDD